MDGLTAFGLAAVTAMLVFYAAEDRSAGLAWHSPERAHSDRSMAFCRAHGRLALSRLYGR